MKYLNDYTSAKQSELFAETGAFFAFSKEQYEEQADPDKQYIPVANGLLVPVERAAYVINKLEHIQKVGIALDMTENGSRAIIRRELANYEVQITNDLTDVIEALSEYPMSQEEIWEEYGRWYEEVVCLEC